jgi:iron-sulfur cluster repair protein YtfE (RIC family)
VGGARSHGPGRPAASDRGEAALEHFQRAHRSLDQQLGQLQQAATAIVRERAGAGELAELDSVLSHLERSAARHQREEEEVLFPRLRAPPGARDLAPLLRELTADHAAHRHLVLQLRSLRTRWPASGPDASHRASLVTLANELARAYRRHIDREERELFPAARERLTASDRAAIHADLARAPRRRPAGTRGPRPREL